MGKFCDGYDNDDVMWIDDPISNEDNRDKENVQRFKNILSTGDALVEVKYETMVFDSRMVIISSNLHPQDMAATMGIENIEPMYRRFTDTCGAFEIYTRKLARENLRMLLLKMLKRQFDLNIDVGDVYDELPTCHFKTFNDIKL